MRHFALTEPDWDEIRSLSISDETHEKLRAAAPCDILTDRDWIEICLALNDKRAAIASDHGRRPDVWLKRLDRLLARLRPITAMIHEARRMAIADMIHSRRLRAGGR